MAWADPELPDLRPGDERTALVQRLDMYRAIAAGALADVGDRGAVVAGFGKDGEGGLEDLGRPGLRSPAPSPAIFTRVGGLWGSGQLNPALLAKYLYGHSTSRGM